MYKNQNSTDSKPRNGTHSRKGKNVLNKGYKQIGPYGPYIGTEMNSLDDANVMSCDVK